MIQPFLLVLCLGAAPPAPENPAATFKRLREEAVAAGKGWAGFAPRFAAHARKYPDHPSAVQALLLVVHMTPASSEAHKQARARLEKHYARSLVVVPLLRDLGTSIIAHESAFLRQVGDTNPDKRVRALAWRALINGRSRIIDVRQRELAREGLSADDLEGGKLELARWQKEVADARAKLKSPDLAGAIADVSVGAKAPPTEAVNLEGKKVALADHRGKVVVLDFWHTRCGPCRRMIPGTNALIAEMKGKPFAQVGVSVDHDREMVSAFLKKTEMPWEHWWVGRGGPQLETWDVEGYPTVYVIDHEGVIRHRQAGYDPAKDKLADIVRALVKKAEAARGAR